MKYEKPALIIEDTNEISTDVHSSVIVAAAALAIVIVVVSPPTPVY